MEGRNREYRGTILSSDVVLLDFFLPARFKIDPCGNGFFKCLFFGWYRCRFFDHFEFPKVEFAGFRHGGGMDSASSVRVMLRVVRRLCVVPVGVGRGGGQ